MGRLEYKAKFSPRFTGLGQAHGNDRDWERKPQPLGDLVI